MIESLMDQKRRSNILMRNQGGMGSVNLPKTNKDALLWDNLGNARSRMTQAERDSTKELVESISIRMNLRNSMKMNQTAERNRNVTAYIKGTLPIKNHNEFYHASLNALKLPHVERNDPILDETLLQRVRDNLNIRRSFGCSPSKSRLSPIQSR